MSDLSVQGFDDVIITTTEGGLWEDEQVGESRKILDQKSVVHAASGLTVATSVLFITGEIAGSGVLALPKAVKDAGWIGLFLIIMCAAISSFTGTVLGRCWTILRENNPKETQHCGDPYPTIGFHAFGKTGEWIVHGSVYFTLFGVCVVLLLIASGNIQSLLQQVNIKISLCYWVIIIGGILAPFCWLKSPKDFWPIALMATLTTAIACFFMFIQMIMDIERGQNDTRIHLEKIANGEAKPFVRGFETFFLAFGLILFGFGGMAAFPTIQADMKEPKKFTKAVLIAMTIILLMYVPIGGTGFGVYGDLVEDNIFQSLSDGVLETIATVLITMHLVFAYVIVQNPLSQVFEKALKIPDQFGWKRVLLRSSITLLIIFTGESCPRFGHILALVGGSAVTLNTFVFPSIFFAKFCHSHQKDWKGVEMPKYEIPLHVVIVVIGVIGGVSATYSAVKGIIDPDAFVPPCYVNITAASGFT